MWLVPSEVWITTFRGTSVASAWMRSEISGDRCQASPKRDELYRAQNSQNEAYHAVVSPGRAAGLATIHQPLITGATNPARFNRSRWVRESSEDWKMRWPSSWSSCRILSEAASFSFTGGMSVHRDHLAGLQA